jgi:hypothetical protein
LLVGWREAHKRLDAYQVRLHQDVFGELAALCQPAIDQLQNYKERRFEPFAALDHEEYFWYEHAALPKHEPPPNPPRRELAESDAELESMTIPEPVTVDEQDAALAAEDDTADLVRLVKQADLLEDATREDLDEGGYSFYAICWPHRGSMIGFVSRTDPIATLKPGVRYFQYGDTMRAVSRPDFALKEGADLVVGADGTAILSPYSFDTLLGDVRVSFAQVQNDVATAKTLLAGSLTLTSSAEDALVAEASRTRANAKRLRFLLDRLKAISLDASSLRASLVRHNVDAAELLDEDGNFAFDRENVPLFFDAVEGRYFEDDLGGEKRRADRYSTR